MRAFYIAVISGALLFGPHLKGQNFGFGASQSSLGFTGLEAIFKSGRVYTGLKYTFSFQTPAKGQEINSIEGLDLQITGTEIRQTSIDILYGYYLISNKVSLEGELSFAMRNEISNYLDIASKEELYTEGSHYTQVEWGCHMYFNVYRDLHLGFGFNTGRNNEIGVRYFF